MKEVRQKPKIHLSQFWLGQNVGEDKKGEKKRKKKVKEKKTKPRYVFVLKSWVFLIPKVWYGDWFLLCLGFCGRDHPNPRFVEVIWVKPQLV